VLGKVDEDTAVTQTRARVTSTTFSETDRAFIDVHRVARLATADAAGVPHVIPIVYARIGDLLYFVVDDKPKRTRTGLKRLRNIRVNPRVAVVVDEYHEDWSRLAYLLVHGRAELVTDRSEYARALEALRERYPQYRRMPLALDTHPMVRIMPERQHFWRAATRSDSTGR
jgi:PPOX class probable F420-dependent enzyme